MFWLFLHISSFTPDSQITVRELLIPFDTLETCEIARKGIVATTHSIGASADSGICVTSSNEEEFRRQTMAWPDKRTFEEKQAAEKARLRIGEKQ